MLVITRKHLASIAAERWQNQYDNPRAMQPAMDWREIHRRLKKLGKTPNPDAVDEAIGNGSWTRVPKCDSCKLCSDAVVPFDVYDNVCNLCLDCLKTAVASIELAIAEEK
jgi:hypothetical protein